MLQAAESRGFSNCLSVALNHDMLDSIFYTFFFFFFFAIAELLDMQPEKKEEVKEAL